MGEREPLLLDPADKEGEGVLARLRSLRPFWLGAIEDLSSLCLSLRENRLILDFSASLDSLGDFVTLTSGMGSAVGSGVGPLERGGEDGWVEGWVEVGDEGESERVLLSKSSPRSWSMGSWWGSPGV